MLTWKNRSHILSILQRNLRTVQNLERKAGGQEARNFLQRPVLVRHRSAPQSAFQKRVRAHRVTLPVVNPFSDTAKLEHTTTFYARAGHQQHQRPFTLQPTPQATPKRTSTVANWPPIPSRARLRKSKLALHVGAPARSRTRFAQAAGGADAIRTRERQHADRHHR